jgi:hypothetical protein
MYAGNSRATYMREYKKRERLEEGNCNNVPKRTELRAERQSEYREAHKNLSTEYFCMSSVFCRILYSTSLLSLSLSLSLILRPTVSRPVCLGIKHPLGLTTRSWLLSDSCWFVDMGRYLWREGGSVVCNCYWLSPAQSLSGPSPLGLATIFYCLRFETSLSVASYNSQDYGGGIRPCLHTGCPICRSILSLR